MGVFFWLSDLFLEAVQTEIESMLKKHSKSPLKYLSVQTSSRTIQ